MVRFAIAGAGGIARFHANAVQVPWWRSDDVHGVSNPNQLDYEPHRRCFEAFAAARQGGAPYPIDAAEARKSVALIEAIAGRTNN